MQMKGDLMKLRFKKWIIFIGVVVFLGLVGAVLYPNDCPLNCKVALFSNSDEVNEIISSLYAESRPALSDGSMNAEPTLSVKNKSPIPSVAAFMLDGKGGALIVSGGDGIVLKIRLDSGRSPQCTVIRPKIEARWCALKKLSTSAKK